MIKEPNLKSGYQLLHKGARRVVSGVRQTLKVFVVTRESVQVHCNIVQHYASQESEVEFFRHVQERHRLHKYRKQNHDCRTSD